MSIVVARAGRAAVLNEIPRTQVLWLGREAAPNLRDIRALSGSLCAAPESPGSFGDRCEGYGRHRRIAVGLTARSGGSGESYCGRIDNPIRSFRNDLFPQYKSDEGVAPELRSQFDTAEQAVRAIGVAVWSMREYEADDGLASGAHRFRDQVEQVRILTPDKDLGQCIQGERVVEVDRRQKKLVNEAVFRAEHGFGPASIPDFLALTGDSADGIPGLAGFGKERSASAWRL